MKPCVLAIVLFAAAGPVAAAQTQPSQQPAACPGTGPQQTRDQSGQRQGLFRPLGELPPAAAMLTVLKSVGGCNVAVVKVGDRHYDAPLADQRPVRREDVTPRRR